MNEIKRYTDATFSIMKHGFFILFLLLVTGFSFAQTCKVIPDSLQGTYNGNCKDGLADGRGTATRTDSYSGQFKSGYPDGTGRYTWKNGSWYDGEWKHGVYEGKGTLHQAGTDIAGHEFTGYWHGGVYLGAESKPYIIHFMTGRISEATVTRGHGSIPGDIIITVYDIINSAGTLDAGNGSAQSSGSSKAMGGIIPKQKLSDIQIQGGSYTNMVADESSSHYNNKYKLFGVVFPIRMTLFFENEEIEIEIFEKGKWDIYVKLEKTK